MSRHHEQIKNDPRWKAARVACLERDGHQCVGYDGDGTHAEGCELDGPNLQADHVLPLRESPDLAFDVDNLQTLSRPCHDQKEREYESSRLIRNTWVNPRYPEISELIGLNNPNATTPVF